MARKRNRKTTVKGRIDEIINHKKIKAVEVDAAKYITKDIHQLYKTVIKEFYRHHKPEVYDRKYKTFEAVKEYPVGQMAGLNRMLAASGIDVSNRFIDGEPYHDKASYVFPRTFREGIHGDTRKVKKTLKPTPKERMDKKFQDYVHKSGRIDKHVLAAAKRNKSK